MMNNNKELDRYFILRPKKIRERKQASENRGRERERERERDSKRKVCILPIFISVKLVHLTF